MGLNSSDPLYWLLSQKTIGGEGLTHSTQIEECLSHSLGSKVYIHRTWHCFHSIHSCHRYRANISTSRHVMGVHNNSVGHKPDCRPPTFELLRKPRGVYVFLLRELCNWCNRLANFCYCNNIDINETMSPPPLSPSSDIWVAEETSAMSLSLWYMSFAWQIDICRNP